MANMGAHPTLGGLPENSGGRAGATSKHPRRRFELKAALSAGGSAVAYARVWNGTTWATTTIEFTVYDAIGSYAGPIGAYGACTWWADSKRWEIDDLQCT